MLRRSSPTFLFHATATLLLFPHSATQRRQSNEAQQHKPNDFDIDKEQWSKQLQMASLECVIDPNVAPINLWTFGGVRKKFTHWVSMKKLQERRPSFKTGDLLDLFVEYKVLQNSLDPEKFRQLVRFTTFAEADRLTKEAMLELHARMKNSSWKTIASAAPTKSSKKKQQQQQTAAKIDESPEGKSEKGAAAAGESDIKKTNSNSKETTEVLARGAATANMAGVPPYEIEVDKFDITNCFIGTMTNEDWIQLTVKAEYREKNATVGPLANKLSTPGGGGSGGNQMGAAALRSKAFGLGGQNLKDQNGFVRVAEFPVFEVKLGDGVTTANNQPFSVVAILDKDGSRHGKDGNDASMLRKNFAQSNKGWFGGGGK